jgi:hypothetical protein
VRLWSFPAFIFGGLAVSHADKVTVESHGLGGDEGLREAFLHYPPSLVSHLFP